MGKGVLKDISKLNKIPHPKSRKTAQLTRKAIRSAARDKLKNVNVMKQNLVGEKFLWFKERIETVEGVTPKKVLELIERYIGRFDEELEQIQVKHTVGKRKGRQHASREDAIKMTKEHEMHEFNTCGIELPDLLNPKQLSMLISWEGELRFLQNFKIVRFSRTKLENLIKKTPGGGDVNSKSKEEEDESDRKGEEANGEVGEIQDENAMDIN